MCKIYLVKKERPQCEKHKDFALLYEHEASEFMSDEFRNYIKKHGYHFTDDLAEFVSKMMVNRNGKEHTWTTIQVTKALYANGMSVPENVTDGDITYLANMYYADLYDGILKDEISCLKTAHLIATDPDGYEGMIFSRWTSDAIAKSIKIEWEKFI